MFKMLVSIKYLILIYYLIICLSALLSHD
uniref:Uncharacterized protein n=1 Tax=Arundo donax TaxID=35708 RepID=A0A0A9A4Y0_ARUDO